MFITENGCAVADVLAEDGNVYDTDRIMFLRAFLRQLQRANTEGPPVKGSIHWSAMDNFEWVNGYGGRFGLVNVDLATQQRTPKGQRRVLPWRRRPQRGGLVCQARPRAAGDVRRACANSPWEVLQHAAKSFVPEASAAREEAAPPHALS
jgi:hypothetical protein